MRRIVAGALDAAAFAPFGALLAAPATPGRDYFDAGLENARPEARPSVSIARAAPIAGLPLRSKVMERHAFSSQSFLPLDVARWLVVVAPDAGDGGPDMARARAFLAGPHQGVTLRMGVWHHPLTVLEREAQIAIVMWRTGGAGDEEFCDLPAFEIVGA